MEWRPGLRAWRGRLLAGAAGRAREPGAAVHAASHIRKRRMIFDLDLRRNPSELSRILVHEVFHFAWVRLSNQTRRSWGALLQAEMGRRACGELGWSAEWRKHRLVALGGSAPARLWSEYACESFCDTAAWAYAGAGEHDEFTLAPRWSESRRAWFAALETRRPAGLRI
ncbi:MAG: hypothetical protein ABSC08_02220 [Bryobacteraceae bacterium]